MTNPVLAHACRSCNYLAYPPRLLCPACAAAEWDPHPLEDGVATEVTRREPGAVALGAVTTDGGVRVIARVTDEVQAGDRVRLTFDGRVVEGRDV